MKGDGQKARTASFTARRANFWTIIPYLLYLCKCFFEIFFPSRQFTPMLRNKTFLRQKSCFYPSLSELTPVVLKIRYHSDSESDDGGKTDVVEKRKAVSSSGNQNRIYKIQNVPEYHAEQRKQSRRNEFVLFHVRSLLLVSASSLNVGVIISILFFKVNVIKNIKI